MIPDPHENASLDDELDGWALWQEHRPQSAEDWIAVAERCAADPTFDVTRSSPLFAALYLAVVRGNQRDCLRRFGRDRARAAQPGRDA